MCLPCDSNNYLLINLGSIVSLASMTIVAWSNFYELCHRNENILKLFLKFESESELGMRYLICKWNLWVEIFNLEDVGFQLEKVGAIQMHMMQSIGTNERLVHFQYMLW